jgi:arsenate reductase
VEYLKTPPTSAELDTALDMLGMTPRDLMRRKEKEYGVLGLADDSLTRDQLISAMAAHPRLIERPIAISGDRAVLGRPIEKLLELL